MASSETPSSTHVGLTEATNEVLDQHSHLDLTEKIELVDQVIRGHGGYSDVYYGRFVDGGKYVAVKRLRVHIQKERQLSKARHAFLFIFSY
jgi:hypothetical protein